MTTIKEIMFNLFVADIKMLLRDRQALFWTMMFPLMFTFLFGMFFGSDNMGGGTIGLVKQSNTELATAVDKAIADTDIFKINLYDTRDEAQRLVEKGQISAVVVIPEKFGEQVPDTPTKVELIYDPASATVQQLLSGVVNGILTHVNFDIQNATPIYSVEETKTNTRKLSYFDFVLIGLIGMALMNSSIQGVGISMSKYREDQILKRITTTPLKIWRFVVAEIASRLILNFVQVGVILLVGVYAFGAHIYGSIPLIFALSLVGALLFQSIGFAVAAMSKTTSAAEGMSTAVSIPMMFLSGVFFPIDQLPSWLYSIIQYLPLSPLLRTIRGIALDQTSPFAEPKNLAIVFAWIVVMLVITINRFRMTEE